MRILPFCIPAGMLALVLMLGAASPMAGVWEGEARGAKAVTLRVLDKGDRVEGTAQFYIIQDEGSGAHNGSASGEIPFTDPVWDGRVLRFSIHGPHGEEGQFTMRVTGPNVAELTVEGRDHPLGLRRTK
jgi:hypothetical protein